LLAVIRKEFIQLGRDRRTSLGYLLGPVLELILFGYVGNTLTDHLPTVVYDESRTVASRSFVAAFQNSGYFDLRLWATSRDEALRAIDGGSARVALVVPRDFGDQVLNGKLAPAQLVVDGSDPNVAQTALSAGGAVAQAQSAKVLANVAGRSGRNPGQGGIDLRPLVLYNPSLQSAESIVPGLIGLFVPFQATLLTAFAVVRERERGTLEQLVVTPITSLELMVGKLLPSIVLAFLSMVLSLLAARLFFGIEVAGSLPLLLLLAFPFLLGSLGIGLLISVASRTQPAAQSLSQLTILPGFFLAGVMFPREGLPPALQFLGNFFPQTYFIQIIRGIMLKGADLTVLWQQALGLSVFGVAILAIAVVQFRKRID
jgi:ABC-2 type transport system permease protein